MNEYLLEMRNIKKAFNRIYALKGVEFQLKKGEIHALLGENGAGKSTLMNILGGVLQADEGEILLEGQPVTIQNTALAQKLGIGFIHQELNLVNDLKVYENLFLGCEIKNRLGFLEVDKMCQKTSEILDLLNVKIEPRAYVTALDSSYKQVLEIAKSLLKDVRILIMDEPTSSLTEQEITYLFKVMKNLKEKGVSIIFISHKLKEVMTICDSFTVFRDGSMVASGSIAETKITEEGLAKMMVGKTIAEDIYYEKRLLGDEILSVENLNLDKCFKNINFKLKKGEILGFTGLAGDGRTELFECVFGCRSKYQGNIYINKANKTINHPNKALKAGLGYAPKNRKENAIIKDFSVLANISLANLKKFRTGFFINPKIEHEKCKRHKENLNIKVADMKSPITSLSGGNQQKVVLSKWIEVGSDILILDNPTQGIDIGAKAEIYNLIGKMAREGKSIIILSSEAPEILKLCDRIIVMYHGEISGILNRENASEETVMMYATGARNSEAFK